MTQRTLTYLLIISALAIGSGYAASRIFNASSRSVVVASPQPTPASEPIASQYLPKSIIGKVVGIADGDTITLLTENQQLKIRLAGIDAPERNQDFGQKSKQFLSSLIFGKTVVVNATKIDKYGRIVGQIFHDKLDANLEMVKVGLAWHYKKYETEQVALDRKAYADAEISARNKRQGVWSIPNPIPPWEFRHPSVEAIK